MAQPLQLDNGKNVFLNLTKVQYVDFKNATNP